jgi:protein-L-isoaspartate(D-aspartate) O-methyltransferase
LTSLAARRAEFAEELRKLAGLRNDALVRAFAQVPREAFLGPGPWRVSVPPRLGQYETTASADPAELCRNVLVAIDESRRLNNGEPAALARWFDALELRHGDRLLHLGCGVGYYTAILAETVGRAGRVLGIEADPALAARASANLRAWPQVEVRAGTGDALQPGSFDAIFVNAGATHPLPTWLDALRSDGRLLVPLTIDLPQPLLGVGFGLMFALRRSASGWEAAPAGPVGIFHCVGARDPDVELELRAALQRGGAEAVRSLRREPHAREAECWMHVPGFCLTRRAVH